jgi:acetyl esterase/lipase
MKSVWYDEANGLAGELHLPERPRPAVVCLFHGGFWRMPHGSEQLTPLAEDLARRGFAAWNLQYRRLGGGGGWPATFADVAAGIDHLAALVEEGTALDLTRVAAVGHSAGGHLALWAGGRARLPANAPGARPRVALAAVCGQAPIADLVQAHALDLGPRAATQLVGGAPGELPERYALASPRARLPMGIPQLIVHGAADGAVPVAMSREYVAAAREAGDDVQLIEPPGIGHFEPIDPGHEAWRVVVEWLEKVL